MEKIRISRSSVGDKSSEKKRLKVCLPVSFELETGEILQRGCGKKIVRDGCRLALPLLWQLFISPGTFFKSYVVSFQSRA